MTRTLRTQSRKVKPRIKPLKARLANAGVKYDEVARLARVSYRMVQYVVDGKRRSDPVMAAIERLAPEQSSVA